MKKSINGGFGYLLVFLVAAYVMEMTFVAWDIHTGSYAMASYCFMASQIILVGLDKVINKGGGT